MKRNEFVRSLARRGCYLHRHGSRHDIYANPKNGRVELLTVKDSGERSFYEIEATSGGWTREQEALTR